MTLLEMTCNLTLGAIRGGDLSARDTPAFMAGTYAMLNGLQCSEAAPAAPAVAPEATHWKSSIRREHIRCLECKQRFQAITQTHLALHGITAAEYRRKWGMPERQSLSSRASAANRRVTMRRSRAWEAAMQRRREKKELSE